VRHRFAADSDDLTDALAKVVATGAPKRNLVDDSYCMTVGKAAERLWKFRFPRHACTVD